MGLPAEKVEKPKEGLQTTGHLEAPVLNLFTQTLIQAICPLFESEIHFGSPHTPDLQTPFAFWAEALISGDLQGKVAVGASSQTIRSLSTYFKKRRAAKEGQAILQVIQSALAAALTKQFREEELKCVVKLNEKVKENFTLGEEWTTGLHCSVETKYGTLTIAFLLSTQNQELDSELAMLVEKSHERKIRVYASQIDELFRQVKQLEWIERGAFSGPQARSRLRFQIKKVKRSVMHLKTEPLENLFLPARRLVADIAKGQGKTVEFQSTGTWLHLDKNLVNYLYAPMLHLVRNAVDHAIEDPLERERVGKSPNGKIKAIASFGPTHLRLLVSDDGRGLDFSRIRARAVAKGIISEQEAFQLLPEDLSQLIFHPGFSTKDKSDLVSGRGLGLDAVRVGLSAIKGSVRVLSTSGHGTSFEMMIPLDADFDPPPEILSPVTGSDEIEDKALLLDELALEFDKLTSSLFVLKRERTNTAAYECFRSVHAIREAVGFMGWAQISQFCLQYEDLLKLVSENKILVGEETFSLVQSSAESVREWCNNAQSGESGKTVDLFPLETRIGQLLWSSGQTDRNRFPVGHCHVEGVQTIFSRMVENAQFRALPSDDFNSALKQPLGVLVQFGGERHGYAALTLTSESNAAVVQPLITGKSESENIKAQLWALSEFGSLMGSQLIESVHRTGAALHATNPVMFYGTASPIQVLGLPTYCHKCEVNGSAFYLSGNFKLSVQEKAQMEISPDLEHRVGAIVREAMAEWEDLLNQLGGNIEFDEQRGGGETLGFDGGVSGVVSFTSKTVTSAVYGLVFSMEIQLAEALSRATGVAEGDFFEALNGVFRKLGSSVAEELEREKIFLTPAATTSFLGKVLLANLHAIHVAPRVVANTSKGRLEIWLIVSEN